jgi:hypothetical protein
MVFRAAAEPLAAGWLGGVLDPPPAPGVAEDEVAAHPATSTTRAVAAAAPRLDLPIVKADISFLTSGRKHPNGYL